MNNLNPNTPVIYSDAFSNEEITELRIKRLTDELKRITDEIILRAEEYSKQQSPDGGMVDTSV